MGQITPKPKHVIGYISGKDGDNNYTKTLYSDGKSSTQREHRYNGGIDPMIPWIVPSAPTTTIWHSSSIRLGDGNFKPATFHIDVGQEVVCKSILEINAMFKAIDNTDSKWQWETPMQLWMDREWDGSDGVPQIDSPCPSCELMTDRTFNMTNYVNNVGWILHSCEGCQSLWFEKVKKD